MSRHPKDAPKRSERFQCPRCGDKRVELGRKNAHCTSNKCRHVGHRANFEKRKPVTIR
jgi:transcription elongation factor Elf1